MGLFKKIGKGLKNASKFVGKQAGKVVSSPLLSGAIGLAAGIALPGIGGALGKGISSVVSKVGGKLKGGKMNSALDGVLDKVEAGANDAAKGFLGIGDGKPGLFGIGTGRSRANKAARLLDRLDSNVDDDFNQPTGDSGTVLISTEAGSSNGGKTPEKGGFGFGGLLAAGLGLWLVSKK